MTGIFYETYAFVIVLTSESRIV